jgi:hypothetical protein
MQVMLGVHVAAGVISVLTGAAALIVRKGGPTHRTAGRVFPVAMAVMATTAVMLKPDHLPVGELTTIYMVLPAWMAARRRDGGAGVFEIGACAAAAGLGILMLIGAVQIVSGVRAAANPYIGTVSFIFAGALLLAAGGDLSVVLRRGVAGAQRIARHLWRMCTGLIIAVGSFAAQGVEALPRSIPRAELMFASMLLVLVVMLYWLVRVLFTGWRARTPQLS